MDSTALVACMSCLIKQKVFGISFRTFDGTKVNWFDQRLSEQTLNFSVTACKSNKKQKSHRCNDKCLNLLVENKHNSLSQY